ncbi:MAG: zinc ABC transporter substrate-binding protein [Eubacterium sp.]|nr:zinc ABC transporter substrate-binding protein [Eubacterium sp.]
MTALKRCIVLFISLTVCFGLSGCKGSTDKEKDKNKLTIMTTLFPYYDFARAVVGEDSNIDVELLVSPGQDDHSFEPTPADVVQINNADVFIYNGGSIENWVEEIVLSLDNQSQVRMKMMDSIDITDQLDDMTYADDEHRRDENVYAVSEHNHEVEGHNHTGNEHEEVDEHIWTSPMYAMTLVQEICDRLCEILPEKSEEFERNTHSYVKRLKEVDKQFQKIVEGSEHKEIIFADKFPLIYFAQRYGLKYYAAFPGCSGDTEPSAKTVAFLIDKVKSHDVNGVFYLELSSQAMADVICDDTKAKKYQFNSCHNITQKQFEKEVTYVDLMRENVQALKSALK